MKCQVLLKYMGEDGRDHYCAPTRPNLILLLKSSFFESTLVIIQMKYKKTK
jgi:hypothetical protein